MAAEKVHKKYGPFSHLISKQLWNDIVEGLEESLTDHSKLKAPNFKL